MITQASDYTWVTNAADLGICGDILPARDVNGSGSQLLKKEDVAFICEALHEKMLGDTYPSYIPRTVNYITVGRNIFDAERGVFDNYNIFKWDSTNNLWKFDNYYQSRHAKFIKENYTFADIPYSVQSTRQYYRARDIYPDCFMEVDWLDQPHNGYGSTQVGPEELYIYNLGIRYPGYYDANDAWHPSGSANINFYKADELRKLYYFLEHSNFMLSVPSGGGMDWINADCDQNELWDTGTVRVNMKQAPTQVWQPTWDCYPPNRLTRNGQYTNQNPTYSLVTVGKEHGAHPSEYEWQYRGYIAESWVQDIVWKVKTFAKFKWLKILVMEHFFGDVSDSDSGTSKDMYGYKWLDLTMVTEGVAADEIGMYWTVPQNYFTRDYCRGVGIANGFPNLANLVNGTDTVARNNMPRFTFEFAFMDLRGEIDAKCEINSLNWQWSPYPPSPE